MPSFQDSALWLDNPGLRFAATWAVTFRSSGPQDDLSAFEDQN